jgi:hypothetical protein
LDERKIETGQSQTTVVSLEQKKKPQESRAQRIDRTRYCAGADGAGKICEELTFKFKE